MDIVGHLLLHPCEVLIVY